MTAKKHTTARALGSDLARLDAHVIQPHEYDDAPELLDTNLKRGVLKRGGRPVSANPRKQVTIRLASDVIDRWRATGPGWQTRIADRLSKV